MTDTQYAAYSAYIRQLADQMLLADWELTLDRSSARDGVWATVRVQYVENSARIWIKWPEIFAESPEKQREHLVHECLHLHMDRPYRVVAQLADQKEDDDTVQFARTAHNNETEICVQRMARLLAPNLPLPPEVVA